MYILHSTRRQWNHSAFTTKFEDLNQKRDDIWKKNCMSYKNHLTLLPKLSKLCLNNAVSQK